LFEQPALLPGLAEAVRGSRWRDSILTALRRLEGEHARLREALTGEDLPLRAAALELLAELEDRSALPYARSLLASGDVELRLQAVNALGKLHDQESVSVLLELLTVPGELQGAAAVALGRIGDRRATAALCALLRPDARGPNIQAEVAEALGHLGDPEAIPVLSEALTAPHAAVRAAAAQSLGKLGDASSIPPLCQGLYDEETSVRQAAATALGTIAERSPTAPIQLRAAIPILRRLGSNLSPDGPAVRPTYREVLRQIEARTASIKELPLPASPAAANADSLPRVSSSGE
jgi:HEAT repeat protein